MFAFLDFSSIRQRLPTHGWLALILAIGIFLRVCQFPDNPPGFYVDEAGVSYEAFSLLHTGADRWGIRLPVYFISWGSGQSVLYAYLSIPFIALFGLNVFASRLPSLFVGILTLPLMYVTVKRAYGRTAALWATFALAILPWHVMISRWALDANLLPFFLLLGTYTVTRALDSPRPGGRELALVAWGLALYAYAIAFIVVPILLLLFLVSCRQRLIRYWREWARAGIAFVFLALPIVLFIIKNFIVQAALPFEEYLPFGLPLLPLSRIAEVTSQPLGERLINSFFITLTGFQDGEIRNTLPGIAATFPVCLPLAGVGVFRALRQYTQTGKIDVFGLWLLACVPLFFPWDLAVNRINAIFIPLLVVAVRGLLYLKHTLSHQAREILIAGVGLLVTIQASMFVGEYFLVYPHAPDAELAFYKSFGRALKTGLAMATPEETILVTNRILLPYFLVAFYSNYPPAQYRDAIRYTLDVAAINVQSLGRFYFGSDHLPKDRRTFIYVLAKWDEIPCSDAQFVLETRLWQVGRCRDLH